MDGLSMILIRMKIFEKYNFIKVRTFFITFLPGFSRTVWKGTVFAYRVTGFGPVTIAIL